MGFLVFLGFAVGLGWLLVRAVSGLRASSAPGILGDTFEKPLPVTALATAQLRSWSSAAGEFDPASGEPGWDHTWALDPGQQPIGAIVIR